MTTFTETACIDCGATTGISDDEPPDHHRCISCFVKHLRHAN